MSCLQTMAILDFVNVDLQCDNNMSEILHPEVFHVYLAARSRTDSWWEKKAVRLKSVVNCQQIHNYHQECVLLIFSRFLYFNSSFLC